MRTEALIWIGIAFCIAQSAFFAGLNLAIFSVSRLRLEVEAAGGNANAVRLLDLRRDSNLTLAAIVWGNVGTNVLLTLLSGSVLRGLAAFAFSTFAITFLGEIVPQAYFSRNALRVTGWFAPVLKVYRVLLFPIAKPTAMLLNRWRRAGRDHAAARAGFPHVDHETRGDHRDGSGQIGSRRSAQLS